MRDMRTQLPGLFGGVGVGRASHREWIGGREGSVQITSLGERFCIGFADAIGSACDRGPVSEAPQVLAGAQEVDVHEFDQSQDVRCQRREPEQQNQAEADRRRRSADQILQRVLQRLDHHCTANLCWAAQATAGPKGCRGRQLTEAKVVDLKA